ncbi:MAG: EAL domain-containing protein [Cyanobacteria bacterium P01_F01_bin.86]
MHPPSCSSISNSYSSISDDVLEKVEEMTTLICHELRTPLTSIQGALKLLKYEQFAHLSVEGEKLLSIAVEGATRLNRLANMLEYQSETFPSLLSTQDLEKLKLANEIVYGLNHQEFFLDYQPIISTRDNKAYGFEALARWHHPSKGLISPEIFIPIAEKSGFIKQLGLFFLEEACHQLQIWQKEFSSQSPITMSLNLSSLQLSEPALSQKIHQALQKNNILPDTLKLEITESALMENHDEAIENLFRLREIGVQIYLDDFGTGYSSLSRLQNLHVDALKIDKSFILSQNWILSEAIILLASRLQLDVIAEGVETSEQLNSLRSMGCQNVQGYYFAKPMSSQKASQFIADNIAQRPE